MLMPQVLSRSIKVKIIVTLVVVVATILTLFEIYAHRVERQLLTIELKEFAGRKIDRLADNISLPLWEIDDKWVNRIIDSEMTDQNVYALTVRGDGGFQAGKVRDGRWRAVDTAEHTFTGDFISLSRDVVYGKEKIGVVTIHLTKKFMENRLRQKAVYGFVTQLCLCLFLVVFLWLFLNRIIIRPLQNILATAKAVGEGDYSRELTIKQSDEIGMLADGVNLMKQKISCREQELDSTLMELQRKSGELQNSHNEMEQKVEQRTRELRVANDRLKELDQLKSMFIASMSHELRTPLNSVIGFSSILLNEWIGPLNGEQKESLSSILRSGKHLLSLINDVIDVSKIEAGIVDVSSEDFDLAELLAETEQTFAKEAEERQLSLAVQELHLPMHTDRRRLLQCILNLVSNAIKFTEQGGIAVAVRHDEVQGEVMIAVTDTGIGIEASDQAKLFQAFSRIRSQLSTKVLGTGLGLYLTKKIIMEIMHGTVSVTSEPGSGSSFSMTIPVRLEGEPKEVQVPVAMEVKL